MKWLKFSLLVGRLKTIKRTGWVLYKVPSPESVAEHSFRTAVLAMFLAPSFGLDRDKVTRMALIHDLGEAVVGDVVTTRGNKELPNRKEKLWSEREALDRMVKDIGAEEAMDTYDEFAAGQTKEAKFVIQLDKLEMAIQAYEYEKNSPVPLSEFFVNARKYIEDPELLKILDEVEQRRT